MGWVALSLGIVLAVMNPPSGYELSIYWSTPLLFWVFSGAAGAIGVRLLISGEPHNSNFEYALLPIVVLSVVSLPIIRRYYYYGYHDPMTHLGWTIDLLSGQQSEDMMLYPALHHLGATISRVTGMPPRTALLIVVVIAIVIWLLSVPILVDYLVPYQEGFRYGVLVACLLLPANPFNVFARVHPTSQALFLSPLILLVVYLIWIKSIPWTTGAPLMSVLLVGLVLLHPLVSLGVAGILATIALVDLRLSGPVDRNSWALWAFSAVGLVLTFLVILPNQRFIEALSATIYRIVIRSGGATVASRTGSLEGLGVGVSNFALRVGGKYILVIPFGLAGLVAWYRKEASPFTGSLIAAGVPLALGVLVFLAAGQANYWGRFVGFTMVPATVVAGVGLAALNHKRALKWKVTSAGVVTLALVLSMATILLGPFVLLPTHHVTEAPVESSETYFEHAPEEEYSHIRFSIKRFEHGALGVEAGPFEGQGSPQSNRVSDHFNEQSISTLEDDSRLILVSGDYKRETQLYNGFRYDKGDFKYINTTDDANHVYAGGFDVYEPQP